MAVQRFFFENVSEYRNRCCEENYVKLLNMLLEQPIRSVVFVRTESRRLPERPAWMKKRNFREIGCSLNQVMDQQRAMVEAASSYFFQDLEHISQFVTSGGSYQAMCYLRKMAAHLTANLVGNRMIPLELRSSLHQIYFCCQGLAYRSLAQLEWIARKRAISVIMEGLSHSFPVGRSLKLPDTYLVRRW